MALLSELTFQVISDQACSGLSPENLITDGTSPYFAGTANLYIKISDEVSRYPIQFKIKGYTGEVIVRPDNFRVYGGNATQANFNVSNMGSIPWTLLCEKLDDADIMTFETHDLPSTESYTVFRVEMLKNSQGWGWQLGYIDMELSETPLVPPYKFLVQDGSDYKSHDGVSWHVVTSSSPTESNFVDNGFTNLSLFKDNIGGLGNNVTLHCYYSDNTITEKTLNVIAPPQPQLVVQDTDISLVDCYNLDSVSFTSSVTGSSTVKCFVSKDQGSTWYGYSGGVWTEYALSEANIESNGITIGSVGSISSEDWMSFLGESYAGVRFALLLSQNAVVDSCEVDTLGIQLDLKGSWKGIPNDGTTYEYEYFTPTSCKVTLKKTGTFKVNY